MFGFGGGEFLLSVERGLKTLPTKAKTPNPNANIIRATNPVTARGVQRPRSGPGRRQQYLYFLPLPQGHGEFRANFDMFPFYTQSAHKSIPGGSSSGASQFLSPPALGLPPAAA